jgi:hypothetical protein
MLWRGSGAGGPKVDKETLNQLIAAMGADISKVAHLLEGGSPTRALRYFARFMAAAGIIAQNIDEAATREELE